MWGVNFRRSALYDELTPYVLIRPSINGGARVRLDPVNRCNPATSRADPQRGSNNVQGGLGGGEGYRDISSLDF